MKSEEHTAKAALVDHFCCSCNEINAFVLFCLMGEMLHVVVLNCLQHVFFDGSRSAKFSRSCMPKRGPNGKQ